MPALLTRPLALDGKDIRYKFQRQWYHQGLGKWGSVDAGVT